MLNLKRATLIRSEKCADLSKLAKEGSPSHKRRTQSCTDLRKLSIKLKEDNELMTQEKINPRSRSTTNISISNRKGQEDFIESSPNKKLHNPSTEEIDNQSIKNSFHTNR